jgi:hypothetical protein
MYSSVPTCEMKNYKRNLFKNSFDFFGNCVHNHKSTNYLISVHFLISMYHNESKTSLLLLSYVCYPKWPIRLLKYVEQRFSVIDYIKLTKIGETRNDKKFG